jgi:hypothetical protein
MIDSYSLRRDNQYVEKDAVPTYAPEVVKSRGFSRAECTRTQTDLWLSGPTPLLTINTKHKRVRRKR